MSSTETTAPTTEPEPTPEPTPEPEPEPTVDTSSVVSVEEEVSNINGQTTTPSSTQQRVSIYGDEYWMHR
tara:strand:- start:258 stop:467 length:210 start_codon:yes stop_codon:yes gene_type:complete